MEINTQPCPDCGTPMDHLSTFGDGPRAFRICPVCNPEPSSMVDAMQEFESTPEFVGTSGKMVEVYDMVYYCKVCGEVGEPDVDMYMNNGRQYTDITCGDCRSDRVITIDDLFDEAEYRMEER